MARAMPMTMIEDGFSGDNYWPEVAERIAYWDELRAQRRQK
jgi:hypothetical protein